MVDLTARLFPDQRLTVFHAYQPVGGYVETYRAQYREVAETNYRTWLETTALTTSVRQRLDVRLELGDPALLLAGIAERGEMDLLVLGTRGLGRIFEFFIGSVAKRILERLPCDALFVRELAEGATDPGSPS